MVVSIITILLFMVICGVAITNNSEGGEIAVEQIETAKNKWKITTPAGTYAPNQTVTVTLKGIDSSGIKSSSLESGNLTVYMNGIPDGAITKTITAGQTSGNNVSYDVALSGFTKKGYISLKIAGGTLTDNASKTNGETYIATGIRIEETAESVASKKGGAILSTTETVVLADDNGNRVPVPSGYKIASDSATTVDYGIVIEDGSGNQFVWVPVDNPEEMYNTISATELGGSGNSGVTTTIKSAGGIIDNKGTSLTRVNPGDTSSYREPDIVTTYDTNTTYLSNAGFTGSTAAKDFAEDLRDSYYTMIASVSKCKGFYIGRYELSGSTTTPTEKAGATLTNTNWYELYKACKQFSTTTGTSRMIWGCQWDEVCKFINERGDKKDLTDSSSYGNYSGNGGKNNTGATAKAITNNIYDLAGNCWEWTQECLDNSRRACRGGVYDRSGLAYNISERSASAIYWEEGYYASRPVIYVDL